jgi:hypothetical protein
MTFSKLAVDRQLVESVKLGVKEYLGHRPTGLILVGRGALSGESGSVRRKIQPDIGTAPTKDRAHESTLDVGQPQYIRPAIGVGGGMLAARDQNAVHTAGAHLAEGDLGGACFVGHGGI